MMDDTEVHIRLTGMVQGVGFRYFVYRKAEGLGLRGYVTNLAGGDVEIVAQGPRGLLEELLTAVKIGPRGSDVTRAHVDWAGRSEEYRSFEIR